MSEHLPLVLLGATFGGLALIGLVLGEIGLKLERDAKRRNESRGITTGTGPRGAKPTYVR